MEGVQTVEAKIADLQTSFDGFKEKAATAFAGLQTTIGTLQEAVNTGSGLSVDDTNTLLAALQKVQDDIDSAQVPNTTTV